jgi:serine/threonine-protein kinase RsbW
MEVLFKLTLPREAASVPVVRRLFRSSFSSLGVVDECLTELELVVTEACTNVLKHARTDDAQYEVEVRTNGHNCDVRVRDAGAGFDHARKGLEEAQVTAEGGRGIHIMRLLVDELQFVSEDAGSAVHLAKSLELRDDSPLRRTLARTYTEN